MPMTASSATQAVPHALFPLDNRIARNAANPKSLISSKRWEFLEGLLKTMLGEILRNHPVHVSCPKQNSNISTSFLTDVCLKACKDGDFYPSGQGRGVNLDRARFVFGLSPLPQSHPSALCTGAVTAFPDGQSLPKPGLEQLGTSKQLSFNISEKELESSKIVIPTPPPQ